MIIIFASIVTVILALIHFVIFKVVVSIFALTTTWRIVVGTILGILGLSFVVASVSAFFLDNGFSRVFYTFSASWLGYATYLFLASCLYALVLLVVRFVDTNNLEVIRITHWLGIICLAFAVIAGTYGLIHARAIIIKTVNITLPSLLGAPQLPLDWRGRKVVWISDIHLGAVRGKSFAQEVVSKINEINPDLVFVGGDLFDGVKVNENEVVKPFAELHPTLGAYFITGNHEEFRDNSLFLQAVKNVGIHVLNNEMVVIDGVQIIGVDDRDSTNPLKFQSILTSLGINKYEPSILLKHQPSGLDIAEKAGISLQISGHTHRAQIWPLNFFASWIFKGYEYGLKNFGNMQVYTSSGVGTWGPPMRVGSDSEIVVLEFK